MAHRIARLVVPTAPSGNIQRPLLSLLWIGGGSRRFAAVAAAGPGTGGGRDGVLGLEEEEQVARTEPRKVWWGPDPTTGVWVPEGQELHTHVASTSSAAAATSAWFRDDVHATSAPSEG